MQADGNGSSRDGQEPRPEFTGAYLVLLDTGTMREGVQALERSAGLSVAASTDLGDDSAGAGPLDADAILFEDLGVAVVEPAEDQVSGLRAAGSTASSILAVEPERVVHAIDEAASSIPVDYLRGYRDGISRLVDELGLRSAATGAAVATNGAGWDDESELTWGLQAVRASESCLSGSGVKLAVLDTGFDPTHPDFEGRVVEMRSFVEGESAHDGHGHGTHCIGTACGSLRPQTLPRYGVAHGADIYAGKVLSNRGSGRDRGILAGINWALRNGCRVVSMSLGAPTTPQQPHSRVFESAARRSLRAGTVIVAAAGNDSRRERGMVSPVSHPANCPSIMAVGAIDRHLAVASFSNSGLNPNGGQVDVCAPGVDVYSSLPGANYARWNGTSMATPHVAGVIALLAESDPDATAPELQSRVSTGARRLPLPSSDVGAGLVQAPSR